MFNLLKYLLLAAVFCTFSILLSNNHSSIYPAQFVSGLKSDSLKVLGQLMFNDTLLSVNKKLSCASCHKEKFCFADSVQFNSGCGGKVLSKNTLSLLHLNSNQNRAYFWEGTYNNLEEAIKIHLLDSNIMDVNDSILNTRLSLNPNYCKKSDSIFRNYTFDINTVSYILAFYLRNIPKNKPTYDSRLNNINANFRPAVKNALQFCQQCHKNTQEVNGMANNGLNVNDTALYIIPPLANLKYTAPYMHDGRFQTLEQVIEFYNSGIQLSPKTDTVLIKDKKPVHLNLSKEDIKEIVALLYSIKSRNK